MNILLLGSGGRECALARKFDESPLCDTLYIAPGNGGTAQYGQNVALNPTDFEAVGRFVADNNIGLLMAGSEDPLVAGIYDYFTGEANLPEGKELLVVGPSKAGAQLEGSKNFAKEFMNAQAIPTARHLTVTADTIVHGDRFLESLRPPYVLKADGLAAGKGVLIVNTLDEAKRELREMLSGMFGNASARVVIEEFLKGIECSVFVVTDGESYHILPVAKDYKRIGEGDTGLNTGGMGAVSPVAFADEAFMEKVEQRIVRPTLEGLRKRNISYRGVIFLGLINVEGEPFVIEYNVRFGDPETEVVLPRLKTDIVELLAGATQGRLSDVELQIDPRAATTVMMVSGGYPQSYPKGKEITGTAAASALPDTVLFHAGTKLADDGRLLTSGGRVIAATALAPTVEQALAKSYRAVAEVDFEGKYFRRDIGQDVLK